MIEVVQAALELQDAFEQLKWRFCFIGGMAIQCWGEPRFTKDVDVTLLTGFGKEAPYIEELLDRYEPRVKDAAEGALISRVLLLQSAKGVGIDIALAALPFEEDCIGRSAKFHLQEGVDLRVCSAEDLIVMKTFAGRAKDWGDLEGIILRQNEKIDWCYVKKQLKPLLEILYEPERMQQLLNLREKLLG